VQTLYAAINEQVLSYPLFSFERPQEALLVAFSADDSGINDREGRSTGIGEDCNYVHLRFVVHCEP
jgi:hypothetical protein